MKYEVAKSLRLPASDADWLRTTAERERRSEGEILRAALHALRHAYETAAALSIQSAAE